MAAALALGALAAAAVIGAADAQQPVVLGYSPVFTPFGAYASEREVAATIGANLQGSSSWACRCVVPGFGSIAASRAFWWDTLCVYAVPNTTAPVSCPSSTSQLLIRDATMAWVRASGLGAAAPLPNNGTLVLAGTYAAGEPSAFCRAGNPATPGSAQRFMGTTRGVGRSDVCTIVVGGSVVRDVGVSAGYEVLASYFPPQPSTDWTAGGMSVPLNPTPSASPTASATPSPSLAAPTPGALALFTPPLQAGSTPAAPRYGYPGGYSQPIPALRVGAEEDGKLIYACVGYLPSTGEAIAGKYTIGAGWSWCDIPHDDLEDNDLTYALIRDSPYLIWNAAAPVPAGGLPYPTTTAAPTVGADEELVLPSRTPAPVPSPTAAPLLVAPPNLLALFPGAAPVSVGTYKGNATVPCRAWRALSGFRFSGPHGGSLAYDGVGAYCAFGFGNSVAHIREFDVLYVLPPTADVGAAAAAATAVPKPSPSPTGSPSATPSASTTPAVVGGAAVWMALPDAVQAGFGPAAGGLVLAGTNGVDVTAGWPYKPNSVYVCRGTAAAGPGGVPAAVASVPGRYEAVLGGCAVGISRNETVLRGRNFEVLVRSPYVGWAPVEGTPLMSATALPTATAPPTFALPAGAAPLDVGRIFSRPVTICRAFHPGFPGGGPFAGYVLGKMLGEQASAQGVWPEGVLACTFSVSGSVVSVSPYEQLISLPAGMTDATWDRSGAPVLTRPSPSVTPSPTPTPSVSPPAPSPGAIEWRNRARADLGAFISGYENRIDTLYVCRGYIPGPVAGGPMDVVPGKYSTGFKACDIPVRGVEVVDADYDLLRDNPSLAWVPHTSVGGVPGVAGSWPGSRVYLASLARGANNTLPPGARLVGGGVYDGLPATSCRANHPAIANSGPHAGYTDGELYGGIPLCFFSFGGGIVRTAPFEYLYVLPQPSASPSPASASPTPSSTRSASGTPSPSRSPSSSSTPGTSRTPSPTPTPTSSNYPSTSATPTRTPQTPTPSNSASGTPAPSVAVNAAGSRIPSSSASPLGGAALPSGGAAAGGGAAGGGGDGGGGGGGGVSPAGVAALVIFGGIAGVCIIGALRKKKAAPGGARGTAEVGATGEGDNVRIVTAGA